MPAIGGYERHELLRTLQAHRQQSGFWSTRGRRVISKPGDDAMTRVSTRRARKRAIRSRRRLRAALLRQSPNAVDSRSS
jgi:hypothetical protein